MIGTLFKRIIPLACFVTCAGFNTSSASERPRLPIPAKELRDFTQAYTSIQEHYVETIDDSAMIEQCIQGMMNGLDSDSQYLNANEMRELTSGVKQRGGIGLQLTKINDSFKVISPLDRTPAQQAGIKAGDIIIRVDNQPLAGMKLSEVTRMLRGEPGSELKMTVLRNGQELPFSITRERIKLTRVTQRMLPDGIGYVRISQFATNTDRLMTSALKKLKRQNNGKLNGLVLDLRDNPGGLLDVAVKISDAFLDEGVIAFTEARSADVDVRFMAKRGDLLRGAPLVILVNKGSAAATEIVAGALKDHQRAKIVGTRTFGRGSIQTIISLANGGALKLTTARWRTPNGALIEGAGITPDHVVTAGSMIDQDVQLDEALRRLGR